MPNTIINWDGYYSNNTIGVNSTVIAHLSESLAYISYYKFNIIKFAYKIDGNGHDKLY